MCIRDSLYSGYILAEKIFFIQLPYSLKYNFLCLASNRNVCASVWLWRLAYFLSGVLIFHQAYIQFLCFWIFTFGLLGLAIFIYLRHILTTVCFLSSKKSSTFSIIFSFILFHIGMDILPYFYYFLLIYNILIVMYFSFLKLYISF